MKAIAPAATSSKRHPLASTLAAIVAVGAVVVFVFAGRGSSPDGLAASVGTVDDFPAGSVTALDVTVRLTHPVPRVSDAAASDVVSVPTFLVNDRRVGFLALYASDPHLGCRVGLASELAPEPGVSRPDSVVFFNPCHGEQYDGLGRYIAGPAPRGLDRFGVTIDGSDVIVDVGAFEFGPER